jgi:hypothetical protein
MLSFGECVELQPTFSPTLYPTRQPSVSKPPSNNNELFVRTIFGTGRAISTNETGIFGSTDAPIDAIFDYSENYIYMTDNGNGGQIRKLAVTDSYELPFTSKYSVEAVFKGFIFIYLNITYVVICQGLTADNANS